MEYAFLNMGFVEQFVHFMVDIGFGSSQAPYLGKINCPCPEQGRNPNSQLLSAIFAPILPTEPENHDPTIHRILVNGVIVILRF